MIANELTARMQALKDDEQIKILSRFFQTGPGQYGEGDVFLGVRVPVTRKIAKEYARNATLDDVDVLTCSPYHEVRLAGLTLLIEIYKRAKDKAPVIDYYLSILDRGNNWDLVDLVAPKVLGAYLVDRPDERPLLYDLAAMDGRLWHQRVAMVSTWSLICKGQYDDALRLVEHFLTHPHPLMHKASGWMLREVGKRGGMDLLLAFLDAHAKQMPRTMLRYAIERLSPEQRKHYMGRD